MCKHVAAVWPDDPSVPSVTCAWLEEHQRYYVSVVRYAEKNGRGKYVVTSCQADTMELGLQHIAEELNCGSEC